jgi:hydrogenase nickel incorporation protein HypB
VCEACGCTVTQTDAEDGGRRVLGHLLDANNRAADHNRDHFNSQHVAVFNLMSSPGAGKTALLEATIDAIKADFRIAVVEGDLETDNDAQRIRARGVPAVQISTGNACHLDARMIHKALHELVLSQLDIVFIENVGNLVCPSSYDLGEDMRLVLTSVTEGEDKPLKYPTIFNSADIAVVTKMDLSAAVEFDWLAAYGNIQAVRPGMRVFKLSAKTGEGLQEFLEFLAARLVGSRQTAAV